MRTFLRLLPLFLLLAAPLARAGENRHLGSIVVAGASLTNVSTAVPFRIPPGAYLTINCSAAVQMLTDATLVSVGTLGTKGVPVPALTNFPTSVGQAKSSISGTPTAVIAFIGTAAVTCDVWARLGTE
jgi:hypothetical protein